jgi:hypothetical protein
MSEDVQDPIEARATEIVALLTREIEEVHGSQDLLAAVRRRIGERLDGTAGLPAPFRHKAMPEGWYAEIDPGIRFAVRVLHAAGFETCQACQGGDGHSYPFPFVSLPRGPGACLAGHAAAHELQVYGMRVRRVLDAAEYDQGRPYELHWIVELEKTWPERADEKPIFVRGYIAT